MESRSLGRSGLAVSAIGFGCGALAGSYGRAEPFQARETLIRALDLGIIFLDTADIYGAGGNERMIGEILGERHQTAVIATKAGIVRQPSGGWIANGRPEYLTRSCEESLKRLGMETIDLFYLHRVDPTVPIEESVGAMARLVETGKVRHLGLSEAGAATVRRAQAVHQIAVLQTEYSLWSRECERELLPTCRDLGIGFVAYCPLGRGLLTGKVPAETAFGTDDNRRRLPRFKAENLDRNVALVDPLRTMAAAKGCAPGQIALAWLLQKGGDIVPIPGTRRTSHLEENAEAVAVRLNDAEMMTLERHYPIGAAWGERYPSEVMARLEI